MKINNILQMKHNSLSSKIYLSIQMLETLVCIKPLYERHALMTI